MVRNDHPKEETKMKVFTIKDLVNLLSNQFGTPSQLPYSGLHFVVSDRYGIAVYPKQSRAMLTFSTDGVTKQLADVPSERSKFGKVEYFKKMNPQLDLKDWVETVFVELKTV